MAEREGTPEDFARMIGKASEPEPAPPAEVDGGDQDGQPTADEKAGEVEAVEQTFDQQLFAATAKPNHAAWIAALHLDDGVEGDDE